MSATIKIYYRLMKPGIIYGNLVTATGGFLFASKGVIDWSLLLAVLAATSAIIGSACVINNYIDRGIDKKMARTKKRALVNGTISPRNALLFASVLGLGGFSLLAFSTNIVTFLVGLVGFIDYVVFYSFWKRRSVWGTVVGSISGATPVAAGYTAVTGDFNTPAMLLFLVLVCWQMPHFYAIATFRLKDYAAAKLPVLPVARGKMAAKLQIFSYVVAFTMITTLLTGFGFAGFSYLIVMMLLGLSWLRLTAQGFAAKDDTAWARSVFKFSLIVILGFSVMISLDHWLP